MGQEVKSDLRFQWLDQQKAKAFYPFGFTKIDIQFLDIFGSISMIF